MRGMIIEVYRNGYQDCTNGGVSKDARALLLVGEGVPEIFKAGNMPVVRLAKGPGNTLRLVPDAVKDRWHMFGGNFGYSGDSRFAELVRAHGGDGGPIKIFDRVEG